MLLLNVNGGRNSNEKCPASHSRAVIGDWCLRQAMHRCFATVLGHIHSGSRICAKVTTVSNMLISNSTSNELPALRASLPQLPFQFTADQRVSSLISNQHHRCFLGIGKMRFGSIELLQTIELHLHRGHLRSVSGYLLL